MSNLVLAYGNLADVATYSGGGWLPALPLTNLGDRRLERVARSVSTLAADTTLDASFPTPRLMRVIALANHNAAPLARRRIRLSSTPDFSAIVHDSGWADVWPTVYPFGSLPWGSPSLWTGKYSAEQIAAFGGGPMTYILPESMNAQYLRIDIDDASNPDGYFQAGRLFAADGWQPVRNMKKGATYAWEDPTEVQDALSGAEYFNERQPYRVVRFELPVQTEDEALAMTFEIQRAVGISKEVLFIRDPGDTVHAIRTRFLGRLRGLSPMENFLPGYWRTPFEIKELL